MSAEAMLEEPAPHLARSGPLSPAECREEEIVARIREIAPCLGSKPSPLLALYVALKSKPLVVVTGPAQSGKVAAVQALARLLTGGVPCQFQEMVGHPWWAVGCRDRGLLAEAQRRFNVGKVQAILEEASFPGNARRLFLAFLMRLSRAELAGLVAELAWQIPKGYISDLVGADIGPPMVFPTNFIMAGTLDMIDPFEWEEPTLRCTAVVPWPALGPEHPTSLRSQDASLGDPGQMFLGSRVWSEHDAALKLRRIPGWRRQWMRPLFEIVRALQDIGLHLPPAVFGEVLIFMSNSFTVGGAGVFEAGPQQNVLAALDAAFAALLLPRIEHRLSRSAAETQQIRAILVRDFPTSAATLTHRESETERRNSRHDPSSTPVAP